MAHLSASDIDHYTSEGWLIPQYRLPAERTFAASLSGKHARMDVAALTISIIAIVLVGAIALGEFGRT